MSPVPGSTLPSPTPAQALEAVAEEIARVPASELLAISLDIPATVVTVMGAAPEIRAQRAALVSAFGESDAAIVDRLELYADAASQAHARHVAMTTGGELDPLVKAVIEIRASLVNDVEALVARKLLEPSVLDGLVGGQAYKDRCFDVYQLTAILRRALPTVGSATPVTAEELDRADAAAKALLVGSGLRGQSESGTSPTADARQRAYTLLVRAYEEARRMLGFVRWHEGDVDEIAPSLWAGRRRKRSPESDVPAAPTSTPNPIPPGLPGASPFQDG